MITEEPPDDFNEPEPEPMKMPKRGRKTKLTDDVALAICGSVIEGNFPAVAAARFGVHKRTLTRWLTLGKRWPEGNYGLFRLLLLESIAASEAIAVKEVIAVGRTLDVKHLEWWLERKFPQRWGRGRGELAQVKRELGELRKLLENAAAHAKDSGYDSATES